MVMAWWCAWCDGSGMMVVLGWYFCGGVMAVLWWCDSGFVVV